MTPEKAKLMRMAWEEFGETGDGTKFNNLFDFSWDGDTLDFKYYPTTGIATVVVTLPGAD